MSIHFKEVAREESGFVAAGSRVNFHDAVRAVGVFSADGKIKEIVPHLFATLAQHGKFRLSELAHLGIVPFDQFLGLFDLRVQVFKVAIFSAELRQRAMFARDRR